MSKVVVPGPIAATTSCLAFGPINSWTLVIPVSTRAAQALTVLVPLPSQFSFVTSNWMPSLPSACCSGRPAPTRLITVPSLGSEA